MKSDINKKAAKIKLLLLDVDGVLTDGSLYYGPQGEAMKTFNVRDGAAIKWVQRAGISVALLTGRQSAQVSARARDLGIDVVIQNAKQKLPAFKKLLIDSVIKPGEIAYMGDDLLDLPVLKRVGLSMAPSDAVPEVKTAVDWVSSIGGGRGAVREACELLLKAQRKWAATTEPYRD